MSVFGICFYGHVRHHDFLYIPAEGTKHSYTTLTWMLAYPILKCRRIITWLPLMWTLKQLVGGVGFVFLFLLLHLFSNAAGVEP